MTFDTNRPSGRPCDGRRPLSVAVYETCARAENARELACEAVVWSRRVLEQCRRTLETRRTLALPAGFRRRARQPLA